MKEIEKTNFQLRKESVLFNFERLRTISIIFLLFILWLVFLNLIWQFFNILSTPYTTSYLIPYSLIFLLNILCLAFLYVDELVVHEKNIKRYEWIFAGYYSSMLILSSVITYIDFFQGKQGYIFVSILIIISALFYIPLLHISVPLIISGAIVFTSLYSQVGAINHQLLNDGIFLIIFLPMSLFVLVFFNKLQEKLHYQQILLKKEFQENKALSAELERTNLILTLQAQLDNLTKLPNRRGFEIFIDHRLDKWIYEEKEISVIFVDIDFFKDYNDFYGHFQGDNALQNIAIILQKIVDDLGIFAARWGGEEFLIINDQEEVSADEICRVVQQFVSDLAIPHEKSTVSSCLTVSIGAFTSRIQSKDEFLSICHQADEALYEMKRSGRNCHIVLSN